jgi:hypothetical protein
MARYRRGYQGEHRSASIRAWITPSERAELAQRAEARGLVVSDYVRACCLTDRLPPADMRRTREDARDLVAALARIGNNLNQMAHRANASGQVVSEDALKAALAELGEATRRIMGV